MKEPDPRDNPAANEGTHISEVVASQNAKLTAESQDFQPPLVNLAPSDPVAQAAGRRKVTGEVRPAKDWRNTTVAETQTARDTDRQRQVFDRKFWEKFNDEHCR